MNTNGMFCSFKSLIDDIVLGYVVSMVEESALEDELDVDGVSEMVSACLPEFSTIEKEAVTEWLLDIESQLRQGKKGSKDGAEKNDPLSCISLAALLPPEPQRTTRVHHLSETSDAGSDSSGEYYADVSFSFYLMRTSMELEIRFEYYSVSNRSLPGTR